MSLPHITVLQQRFSAGLIQTLLAAYPNPFLALGILWDWIELREPDSFSGEQHEYMNEGMTNSSALTSRKDRHGAQVRYEGKNPSPLGLKNNEKNFMVCINNISLLL